MDIFEIYADDLRKTPGAERIAAAYEKGLITYGEAIETLIKAEKESHNRYIIQYKGDNNTKYHTFDDILYTKSEAAEELDRLNKTAGAIFNFRMKKAAGYY